MKGRSQHYRRLFSADLCGCTDVIFQQKGHTMTMGFSGASVSFYSAHGCQEGDVKAIDVVIKINDVGVWLIQRQTTHATAELILALEMSVHF